MGNLDGKKGYNQNMYAAYFGLRENPFALPPDPRYLYMSLRHQEALAHLMYGITQGGGFVQLTGEVGTGKTMMVRALLERLPKTVDVALVLYPFLSVHEFLGAVCADLRVQVPEKGDSIRGLIDALNRYLLENHANGRRTVLIIDEAQKLSHEVLEQIRLLTNLETTKEKLLQILLIGQPELNSLLAQKDLRQLAQRITARYNLKSLMPRETAKYIVHRCRAAGARNQLFTLPALHAIHRLARGTPRIINVICDRALLGAYSNGKNQVTVPMVRRAASEIGQAVPRRTLYTPLRAAIAGAAVLIVGLGVWLLAPSGIGSAPQEDPTAAAPASPAPAIAPANAAPAPAAENAARGPAPVPASSGAVASEIGALLATPGLRNDTDTAFAGLFTKWGKDYNAFPGRTGCERAQQAGLRCLFKTGSWNNLRQFNRPAVMELIDAQGNKHHVLASSLDEKGVTLEMGGKRHVFSMADVDQVWFGKFLLLWMPPPQGDPTLQRGATGASVAWLRDAIDRYYGQELLAPDRQVFDAALEERVREFQRQHQIEADGVVGRLTWVQLDSYDSNAPPPYLVRVAGTGAP